jgi:xylitol oxidase
VPLEQAQEALSSVWEVTRNWKFSSPWGYDKGQATMGDVDAMEFRQVKGGDGAWLSPHPVDSLGIHFSFKNRCADRKMVQEEMVPAVEKALEPFGLRAHWGKLGKISYEPDRLEDVYGEGLEAFRELCAKHDAAGKFRNSHVSRILFPS